MKPLYTEGERETVMSLCPAAAVCLSGSSRLTIWQFGKREGRMEGKKDECTSCVSEKERVFVFESESVGVRKKKEGGWSLFENSN